MKLNVNTKPYKLKPYLIPNELVLVIDTREQLPLFTRTKDLLIVKRKLDNGDYSLQGFEDKFVIERKGINDFYAYISSERNKTEEKMKRLQSFMFAGLVIEANESDLLAHQLYTKTSPEVARQSLVSFEVRYGVHVYYSRSPQMQLRNNHHRCH